MATINIYLGDGISGLTFKNSSGTAQRITSSTEDVTLPCTFYYYYSYYSRISGYTTPIYFRLNGGSWNDLGNTSGGLVIDDDNIYSIEFKASGGTPSYNFTVKFNSQGGSSVSNWTFTGSSSTVTKTIPSKYLPGGTSAPTWANHTFLGWATTSGQSQTIVGSVLVTSGTAKWLYALWRDDTPTTATLKTSGGLNILYAYENDIEGTPKAINQSGSSFNAGYAYICITDYPPSFSSGYGLPIKYRINDGSWSESYSTDFIVNFSSGDTVEFTCVNSASHYINYYKNSSSTVSNWVLTPQIITSSTLIQPSTTTIMPNRSDRYYFIGWNDDINGEGTWYEPGEYYTDTSYDLDLYAQWEYIGDFKWGSSDSWDLLNIAAGQPVTNLKLNYSTDGGWNGIIKKVNQIYNYINKTYDHTCISPIPSSSKAITATRFNNVRYYINGWLSSLGYYTTPVVYADDEIMAKYFVGTYSSGGRTYYSLKYAINVVIANMNSLR